ncbi:MAG TPA: metallophosphoesterase [Arenibacter sp.]|nr:metallophosphoesterase [Arenibacter sp.]
MDRRHFIGSTGLGLLGLGCATNLKTADSTRSPVYFSLTENRVDFYSDRFKEPIKLIFIADTHLWESDSREDPYRQYSGRMAKAYNQTIHFQTGSPTDPKEGFESALQKAVEGKADLFALVGDIVSYPSEVAIEWVRHKLDRVKVPYLYTGGNHDWHYEGMEGSSASLREKWTEERLKPLYQNENPLMTYRDIKGVRFITMDNSIYEILPEQLTMYEDYSATDRPIVLMAHIPFYAPGRSVGYGCGHPQWNAENDRSYSIERRPRWPRTGHSEVTYNFHKKLFSNPNLLGVFCGHIHKPSVDIINGIPQVVAPPNLSGGYLDINFLPL